MICAVGCAVATRQASQKVGRAHDLDALVLTEAEKLPVTRDKVVNVAADRRRQDEIVFGMRRDPLDDYSDVYDGGVDP